jgi:hypothetical protein
MAVSRRLSLPRRPVAAGTTAAGAAAILVILQLLFGGTVCAVEVLGTWFLRSFVVRVCSIFHVLASFRHCVLYALMHEEIDRNLIDYALSFSSTWCFVHTSTGRALACYFFTAPILRCK